MFRSFAALAGVLILCGLSACSKSAVGPDEPTPPGDKIVSDDVEVYSFRVVTEFPHDIDAFTQGLVLEDGVLYEGTGLRSKSTLRRVDLQTGAVQQKVDLAPGLFGEGITVFGDRIIQLTFTSGRGLVYDRESFSLLREFTYPTQGWGLTHDGNRLIMSDGTSSLYFLDPVTFARLDSIEVRDENAPVTRLNELEYIQGLVFANVWLTDLIAVIDPTTGIVGNWIDLTGLLSPGSGSTADVLNGIAFDSESSKLYVTGKLWPKLFEIELVAIQ